MNPPESYDNDFDAIASEILDTTSEVNAPDGLTSEQYRLLADYQLMDALLTEFFREDSAQLESCIDRAIRAIEAESEPVTPPWPIWGLLGNAYHGAVQYLPQQVFLSYLIGGIFTGLLILVASLVTVTHSTPLASRIESAMPSAVKSDLELIGRVTGMVDVRWSDPNTSTEYGAGVSRGRKYALDSGLMEISYDSGAKVILQGPVTYEVDSRDGGFLSLGKLTARLEKKPSAVSGQRSEKVASKEGSGVRGQGSEKVASETNPEIPKSQIPNPSSSPAPRPQSPVPAFAVRTPLATVTDLGTEFGVEVSKEGTTTSHVFQGLVRVQIVSTKGIPEGQPRILGKNQSVCVRKTAAGSKEEKNLVTFATPADSAGFVREIPHQKTLQPTIKMLDLVDIVAGGNGFSGKRNAGIDATTGKRNTAVDYIDPTATGDARFPFPLGDGKYHRVDGLPFIDGVFIPDGSHGPVQVDSAGHLFEDCPKTANRTAHYLWAGSGDVPTAGASSRTTLGIIDYAQKEHCYLFIHSNKGVTFNLEAIRKANPDATIRRFLAVLGNASEGSADVWILFDGKERFCRREISNKFVAMPVNIPIRKEDRFLTLIATDGGDDIFSDWIMLGDPRLELAVNFNNDKADSKAHASTGKEAF